MCKIKEEVALLVQKVNSSNGEVAGQLRGSRQIWLGATVCMRYLPDQKRKQEENDNRLV